ncbi:hypothetical protein [Halostella salina]|uniref:hypothetical protein n=1 Tax=Halostella salina TaxID=1547897 RepID=UPI0013CE820C|nr:hypothetical protein [Halostella salina]
MDEGRGLALRLDRGTVVGKQEHKEETIVDVQTTGEHGDGPVVSKDNSLIDLIEVRQHEDGDNSIYAVGLTVNENTEEIGDLKQISVHDSE